MALAGGAFTSCSDDDLSSKSVIEPSAVKENAFDKWIKANYIDNYNVEFKYRYEHNETDMNYYNVPANYDDAVKLAHIVLYTCLEAYDQVAGEAFTRAYFPKMFYAVGDFEYRNNGTIILGTAEGGKKIFLAGTNHLNQFITSREALNEYYLKTIHHEFTHILNQTKPYSNDFRQIVGDAQKEGVNKGYIKDSWSEQEYSDSAYYLPHGFISAYSQHSHEEDFAEMLSIYLCNTPEQWAQWMTAAGETGAALIERKLEIVKDYMKKEWGVDLDELRDEVITRENDVVAGNVDLTDLTVE